LKEPSKGGLLKSDTAECRSKLMSLCLNSGQVRPLAVAAKISWNGMSSAAIRFSGYLPAVIVIPIVVPIGSVIAAPSTIFFHSFPITVRLPAVFTVPGGIPVEPGPICFEPPVTIVVPISIRSDRSSHSQQETPCKHGGQSHSGPKFPHDSQPPGKPRP
jgi:hypothetical protein